MGSNPILSTIFQTMKINFSNIPKGFDKKEYQIENDDCILVVPMEEGAEWNSDSLIFQSSIWRKNDGQLISAGLPKFFNWGERSDISPTPQSLKDCYCYEKIDGSCLIVSWYKNNMIARTRGTSSVLVHDNGKEAVDLLNEYGISKIFENYPELQNFSFIFEWVSPNNRIVIPYEKADLYFLGVVDHTDYRFYTHHNLPFILNDWGVPIPQQYFFDTVSNLLNTVQEFKGKEGVCLYSPNGIHKVKGIEYLTKHRLKDLLGTFKQLLSFWYQKDKPGRQEFLNIIENEIDYETRIEVENEVNILFQGYEKYLNRRKEIKEFVDSIDKNQSRKQIAYEITNHLGKDSTFGFLELDGRKLPIDKEQKILYDRYCTK